MFPKLRVSLPTDRHMGCEERVRNVRMAKRLEAKFEIIPA